MSQIASLFARLGFDVDSKGLAEFEKKLDRATKNIKIQGAEAVKAGAATDKATEKTRKTQHQLAKEIRRDYAKVRTDRLRALADIKKINAELAGGKLKDGQRRELLESRGRVQQRLNDLVKRENAEKARLDKARQAQQAALDRKTHRERMRQRSIEERRDFELWKKRGELARQERARERRDHQERMREASRYGRARRGISYRGAREYGRAWIPGLGGAFAATQSTQAYQGYVGTQAGLTAATGSREQAGVEFEWLTDLSKRLGVYIGDMSKSFTSLSANTRNTSLEGQGTRDIFEAVTSYSRVLNLSAADQDGVFRALTQMVGKGQVYAEELRQQMGERLPGSFQAMARAAGYGSDEAGITAFYKAVENGEIRATEVFPKFAEELMKMANEGGALEEAMNNTSAAIGRFRTNVYLANKTLNESGYDEAVRRMMNRSSEAIDRSTPVWELLGAALNQVGLAVEVPIELFGALGEKLPIITDYVSRNSTAFTILAGSLVAAIAPLRRLFLLVYGVAAISDLMLDPGRERSWAEWVVQLGLAAGALGTILMTLRSIFRIGRSVTGIFGGGFGGGAAAGAAGNASMWSPLLRVTVVGFAVTALGALGALIYDAFQNGVSTDTGSAYDAKMSSLRLPETEGTKWFDRAYSPLLNSNGGIGAGELPFGQPVYGRELEIRRGLLNDRNVGEFFSRQQASPITQQSNEITINIESPDPERSGYQVETVIRQYLDGEYREASASQQRNEK